MPITAIIICKCNARGHYQTNHLSALRHVTAADPAPSTQIYISTLNGSAMASVLPDSGANISTAGPHLPTLLDEHPANLLPSHMSPHSASGHKTKPIGKLTATLTLQDREYCEDLQGSHRSYDIMENVQGPGNPPTLLPRPTPGSSCLEKQTALPVAINAATIHLLPPPTDQLMTAFPTVFDGHIRVM